MPGGGGTCLRTWPGAGMWAGSPRCAPDGYVLIQNLPCAKGWGVRPGLNVVFRPLTVPATGRLLGTGRGGGCEGEENHQRHEVDTRVTIGPPADKSEKIRRFT